MQAVYFVISIAILLAVFWYSRTDTTDFSRLLGIVLCAPFLVLCIPLINRLGRPKAPVPQSNFWNGRSAAFILIYVVILLAVTIVVYFELNLVAYLASMLVFAVLFPTIMILIMRYVNRSNARSA